MLIVRRLKEISPISVTSIKRVYLCFDNDEAGKTANKRISEKLNKINIQNEILIPKNKDWNEDLTLLEKGQGDICQAL